MSAQLHAFDSREAVVEALTGAIAGDLANAVAERGQALFLATGGVTPIPVYEALSHRELAWDRVTVFPSDARWLAEDQDGSNDGMLRRTLLRDRAAGARFHPLFGGEPTPEAALPRLRARIAGLPRPDVALLGMGEDGHTLSLFKGAPNFDRLVDLDNPETIEAVYAPQGAMTPHRLSMTRRHVLTTRRLYVLFFGAAKRAMYDAAMRLGPLEALPLRAILLQDRVDVSVYWAE